MMKKWNWKAAIAGAAAGIANGLFGAGGGMVLIPWLSRGEQQSDKRCFPTALAIMLPLSVVSLVVYWKSAALPLDVAWPYLAGGVAGGILGGLLLRRIPVRWLHLVMGLLLLWGGVRLLV